MNSREDIARCVQELEQNPSYKPGAGGEPAPKGKEFSESKSGDKRKHVGRGGMKD